jgi:23S rRNA (uracil1939-C5)-methyltransferase
MGKHRPHPVGRGAAAATPALTVSSFDADGFAHTDHTNRLRLALPGERLRAAAVVDFFLPKEIIAAHPQRLAAPCPHYGRCGGCDLQHAAYALQLALKGQLLHDLLAASRNAQVRAAANIPAVLPSPRRFGYRQRLRLVVDGHGCLAFRGFRSHETVAIGHCLLARQEINAALAAVTAGQEFRALSAVAEEVEFLLNPDKNQVDLLVRLTRPSRPAGRKQARRCLDAVPGLGRIFFYGEKFLREPPVCRDGEGAPRNEPLSLTYPPSPILPEGAVLRWPVGGFSQVNIEQNQALMQLVVSWAAPIQDDSVLELFCGAGNFSMPLARRARSLFGVEGQGTAIRQARDNARLAGLGNCRFEKADVHDFCRALAVSGQRFPLILLDPPRAGVPGLADTIRRLCDGRLVLISCDPVSLVRDLSSFCQAGFALRALQPIDMFPQTHHLETVALLEV